MEAKVNHKSDRCNKDGVWDIEKTDIFFLIFGTKEYHETSDAITTIPFGTRTSTPPSICREHARME